jgi:UDP-N-acetylmuramoyl-L-alanyl-D-glutamate--2,6-diaminopimelate ligase
MNDNKRIKRPVSLIDLFAGFGVRLPEAGANLKIEGISVDSRTVRTGDLFIAVPGHSQDGRRYIAEAASLGAVAILTIPGKDIKCDIPVIFADDLRPVAAGVASRFYENPSRKLTVSGVTGTNGKTTTTYLLTSILRAAGRKWGKIGTIGYDTGSRIIPAQNTTPGPVEIQKFLAEMVENGMDGCAMEASSHALDQGRCEGISFSSATFTNLTQDHLDYHENMEKYFQSKAALFTNVPRSIINIDDEYGRRLISLAKGGILTYGSSGNAGLEWRVDKTEIGGSRLQFKYEGQTAEFELPIPGIFNHYNAAAAGATALALGMSLPEVAFGLSRAAPVPGRMQAVSLGQPFGVYVDYAHTPGALERLLQSVKSFKPRKIHVVFGCGGDRDVTKRPLMAAAVSNYADRIYLTSDNPRTEDPARIIKDALSGITDKKKFRDIEDRALAIKTAIVSAEAGDIVVIAGKGHEEYQITQGVKKYFSDIEAAKAELRKLGYEEHGRE